jgi:hypothetical protein
VARFSVEVLQEWKADAEGQARARVGKIAAFPTGPVLDLKVYARVRMGPIIPREHERSEFILEADRGDYFIFEKEDSSRRVDIPKSFIEKIEGLHSLICHGRHGRDRTLWYTAERDDVYPDAVAVYEYRFCVFHANLRGRTSRWKRPAHYPLSILQFRPFFPTVTRK